MKADLELYLRVKTGFGYHENYCAAIKIPDMYEQCFEPLKITDDPWMAMATGDKLVRSKVAETVVRRRKDAAEDLAKQLKKYILEAMAVDDTYNGYRIVGEK